MLAVLRAVLDRVLPQADVLPHGGIDLGRLIDERLSTPGDGWRFAELPPDADAYAAALRTLDRAARERAALPFILLDRAGQDDLLRRADAGTLTVTPAEGDATLSAAQMRLWCLDLRADAAQAFVSHPAVMARLGIDSALNGGDAPMQGFEELRAGHHAPWEPPAPAALPGHVA
nr:gluconate 2-dehydrogenase subunit 3 family protein [Ameyamaea chiangmaiensis]